MPETTITIIVVLHCYEPDLDKATVYLAPGEYTVDDPMPDEDGRPIKIVGPLAYENCMLVRQGMKRAFDVLGLRVIEHEWPDD